MKGRTVLAQSGSQKHFGVRAGIFSAESCLFLMQRCPKA